MQRSVSVGLVLIVMLANCAPNDERGSEIVYTSILPPKSFPIRDGSPGQRIAVGMTHDEVLLILQGVYTRTSSPDLETDGAFCEYYSYSEDGQARQLAVNYEDFRVTRFKVLAADACVAF